MQMVHYGFSRDEVYFMPISELNDYIKLLNQSIEEEEERQREIMSQNTSSTSQEPLTSGMINM